MNSKLKKLLCIFAVCAILLAFGVFAMGSGGDEGDEDQGNGSVSTDEGKSNLGDYHVDIKACRMAKDFEGKPIVIITYVYTNNGDEAMSFMVAVDENVYQNGIGLNECYFVEDGVEYSSDNQMKDIKPGATLEVEVAYELNDTTTDVEVEVSELFSFSDKKVVKKFTIAK